MVEEEPHFCPEGYSIPFRLKCDGVSQCSGTEFVVSFSSRSITLKPSRKSHQMTPFFVQKEVFGEIWQCFYSKMMFSLKKGDHLRVREQEREEKETINSAPQTIQ